MRPTSNSGFASSYAGNSTRAALPDVTLLFDDHGSPWHTRCVVEAPDEPGLLHLLTVAFASAGVNVHGASITTSDSGAIDTFELTTKNGAKLDENIKERLRATVAQGVRPRRRRVPAP